jgi:hypothetical protein
MFIKVSEEFTDAPGGRYSADGPYSAEEFRTNMLDPNYRECLTKNEPLIIDLDGGYGYSATFLEESFGGMVRLGHDADKMLEIMKFISEEQPNLVEEIKLYILESKRFILSRKPETINV